jgi:hypothetical protein
MNLKAKTGRPSPTTLVSSLTLKIGFSHKFEKNLKVLYRKMVYF